jgi:hypothetical protein
MEDKNIEETLVDSEVIAKKPDDEDRVKRRRSYLYCIQALIMALIVATTLTIIHHKTPTESSPIETTESSPIETTVETIPITNPIQVTEPTPETTVKDIWDVRREEYPVATEVWLYMKNVFGWSDIVCAGIMGNLMRETGGDTLHLKPESNSNMGLGLVQWTGQRKEDIFDKHGGVPSIVEQLEFIKDELYGTNGVRQQVSDWQRDKIFNAKTAAKSAEAFARWFERPASTNYTKRKTNAVKAYEYFVEEV